MKPYSTTVMAGAGGEAYGQWVRRAVARAASSHEDAGLLFGSSVEEPVELLRRTVEAGFREPITDLFLGRALRRVLQPGHQPRSGRHQRAAGCLRPRPADQSYHAGERRLDRHTGKWLERGPLDLRGRTIRGVHQLRDQPGSE